MVIREGPTIKDSLLICQNCMRNILIGEQLYSILQKITVSHSTSTPYTILISYLMNPSSSFLLVFRLFDLDSTCIAKDRFVDHFNRHTMGMHLSTLDGYLCLFSRQVHCIVSVIIQ